MLIGAAEFSALLYRHPFISECGLCVCPGERLKRGGRCCRKAFETEATRQQLWRSHYVKCWFWCPAPRRNGTWCSIGVLSDVRPGSMQALTEALIVEDSTEELGRVVEVVNVVCARACTVTFRHAYCSLRPLGPTIRRRHIRSQQWRSPASFCNRRRALCFRRHIVQLRKLPRCWSSQHGMFLPYLQSVLMDAYWCNGDQEL